MVYNQKERKVFIVVIAILLIANITMLTFLVQQNRSEKQDGRQNKKAMVTGFLKNEIGFSQQQLAQYDTLSNRHREKITRLYDSARNRKNEQFKKLAAIDFSDSSIDQEATQSAALQKSMEVQMFSHFKNIRQLCTPAQLAKFDTSFYKVFNKRGERKKPGR